MSAVRRESLLVADATVSALPAGTLMPDPAVTKLDGWGHFVPLECPDRLAAALLDWHAEVVA